MTDLDRLKKAFRGHKTHCATHSSGYELECNVKSLAYAFIKDSIEVGGAFAVKDIIEACEVVIAEE